MVLDIIDVLAMLVGYILIIFSICWLLINFIFTIKLNEERFIFKIFGYGFVYCFDKFSRVYHNLNNHQGSLNKRFFWVNTDRYD